MISKEEDWTIDILVSDEIKGEGEEATPNQQRRLGAASLERRRANSALA